MIFTSYHFGPGGIPLAGDDPEYVWCNFRAPKGISPGCPASTLNPGGNGCRQGDCTECEAADRFYWEFFHTYLQIPFAKRDNLQPCRARDTPDPVKVHP